MRISDWSSDVCSSDLFGIVILGESDFDRLFLASLYADELIFEAGNQIAGTDDNGHPLARTTFKGLAIDLADEVHDDLVAVLGFMPFRRGFVALLLRRNALDGLVNLLVLDLSGQALQLQAIDGRCRNVREHFQLNLYRCILAKIGKANCRERVCQYV